MDNRYPNQNFKLISGDKKHKQNAYTTVYIGSAGFAVYTVSEIININELLTAVIC